MREKLEPSRVFALPPDTSKSDAPKAPEPSDIQIGIQPRDEYIDIHVPSVARVAGVAAVIAAAAAIAYFGQTQNQPKNRDSHTASAPASPDQQPGAQQLAPATAPDAGAAIPKTTSEK